VLGTALSFVGQIVVTFCYVYILLILLYVISAMLQLPYSIWLSRIQRFLYDVCEPYLRLFRRHLPAVGPLDLSPFVARSCSSPLPTSFSVSLKGEGART